jgi:hypothetical protein
LLDGDWASDLFFIEVHSLLLSRWAERCKKDTLLKSEFTSCPALNLKISEDLQENFKL